NQSIGQYLYVHKYSFSNPPFNRRLEDAVVVDWPTMMKFKASQVGCRHPVLPVIDVLFTHVLESMDLP
ncbi:hypothetical protein AVEN_48348-1, partial [Araneus ventricosus]